MQRVLVLSENKQFYERLKTDLEKEGYLVRVQDYTIGVDDILRFSPALTLFDIADWDSDKQEAYNLLNTQKSLEGLNMSLILFLGESSLSFVNAKLEFDDFVLTPYRLPGLRFRIKRSLAQKTVESEDIIQAGALAINHSCYEVKFSGTPVDLTYKEYELLKYLATNRGRAFTRDNLLNAIWGYDYYGGTRTVDVHIRRIRAKIGDISEEYIKTIRGVGYMFV